MTTIKQLRGKKLAAAVGAALAFMMQSAAAEDGDAAALAAFAQAAGDQAPQLARDGEGRLKLEWRGNVSGERYHNDITPPPGSGNLSTPYNTGSFNKWTASTELKLLDQSGGVTSVQGLITGSNDRAALSRYSWMLNQLQINRQSPGLQAQAGDVMANFSPLGSTLGMRGLQLTRNLGPFAFSVHGGVVAESWEALVKRTPLDSQPARNQYLRDVFGVKTEYSHSPTLKGWFSWQGFNDRPESVVPERRFSPEASTRSLTAGLNWQGASGTLLAEWARSDAQRGSTPARRADALIVDATWRLGSAGLRAGWHDVQPDFLSLAQTMPPGIREYYVGVDWTAAPWLMLGADWRDSDTRFAQPLPTTDDALFQPFIMPTALAQGLNARATVNFGPNWPGWSLTLQNGETANESSPGMKGRGRNSMLGLGFNTLGITGNLSFTDGYNRLASAPQSDSSMDGWQLSLGRSLTLGAASGQPWMLTLSLNAGRQNQRLVVMEQVTRSRQHGLTLAVQQQRFGQLNVQWSDAWLSPPMGGPDLLTRTVNLDYTRQLSGANSLRAYWRLGRRNIGQPTLETTERVAGLQFNLSW
jgi:hypothetical protein